MVNFERKETYSLQDLIEILRILRARGGCHGIARRPIFPTAAIF